MDTPTRLSLFGTDEHEPAAVSLQAGPVSLCLQGTRLRALMVDGHEVLHGVAFLFRDTGWATPEPVVDRCDLHRQHGGFEAEIDAHVPVEPRIDLRIHIRGDAKGQLRYEATAVPRGDIDTQRLGLCVMHPMAAEGQALEVEHGDGRLTRSSFPRQVPAWPPFTDVRQLRHAFSPGAWTRCTLEGDSFELEDQRNNADASFKLYSRSNQMPRPYRLRRGVAVTQALTFALEGRPASPCVPPAAALGLGPWLAGTPVLGIGVAPADLAPDADGAARVALLAPVQLHLVIDSLRDALDFDVLARCVAASGRPLRLDVRDAAHAVAAQFEALALQLRERHIALDAVAAFPATPPTVEALRAAFPGAAVGGGTPYFFAQINRLDHLGAVDFVGFTVSAIVHGADDESPMHGLQCLPSLIDTVRVRHPGVGVRVGPSSIAAPRSPLGRQPDSDGRRRIALARRDPRSGALYGAAWLVGHLGALVPTGLQALSLWGLGDGDGLFVDEAAAVPRLAPGGWVVRELRGATRCRRVQLSSPASSAALAIERGAASSLLLAANLGASMLRLRVDALPAGELHLLDAGSWSAYREGRHAEPWQPFRATEDGHWQLPPYAIVRLVSQ